MCVGSMSVTVRHSPAASSSGASPCSASPSKPVTCSRLSLAVGMGPCRSSGASRGELDLERVAVPLATAGGRAGLEPVDDPDNEAHDVDDAEGAGPDDVADQQRQVEVQALLQVRVH